MAQMLRKRRKVNVSGLVLVILLFVFLAGFIGGAVMLVLDVSGEVASDASQIISRPESSTTAPTETKKTLPQEFLASNTVSEAALLYDLTAGEELFAKNGDRKMYPASITKLLTAVTALQYCDVDLAVTVGDELSLVQPGSSVAGLRKGWKLTVEDLIAGLMLPSGNDAAYTLAVTAGRIASGDASMDAKAAIAYFCGLMNQTAAQIGAANTNFTNPDGYHAKDHYTTVRDLQKIIAYALQNQTVRTYTCTGSVKRTLLSGQTVTWKSTNLLLRTDSNLYYEYAIGGKTGSTDAAGSCLFALAEREGRQVCAIVLKAPSNNDRYIESRALLDLVLS